MSTDIQQADDDVLTPREAQSRLAQVFASDEDGETADQPDSEAAEGDVVELGPQSSEDTENPFATEAALASAMRKIEALLFASPEPISQSKMEERIPGADIETALEKLEAHYRLRGVNLRQVDKKWQFVTAPDVATVLVEHREQAKKLSRAALETLAIIAYHQPCTRADIEEVRGVAVAKGSLDQLMELGWVRLRGKRDAPGRPVLYGTTSTFLEHFGLADVSHLPGMADLKAAGLLEARLPPGFSVPTPRGEDDETADDGADLSESNFATDFHEEGDGKVDDDGEDALDMDPSGAFPDADDEPF